MYFTNKVIWITGASSGIGEGLAKALSKSNCKLILSGRNLDRLLAVKKECESKASVEVLALDLEAIESMEAKVKEAIEFYDRVDILINNAGISQRSLIINTDLSVYRKLMEVNYLGTLALTKALLPHFIQNKSGQFVVVSSLMGKFSSPYRSGYCGAKHALHGFFDALRMEHEKDGLLVTLVCPGFVRTNVAINALVGDGNSQQKDDEATQNGMPVSVFCKKMLRAIEQERFEVYIAGSEKKGIWVKRLFPKLLHKLVLRSQVR